MSGVALPATSSARLTSKPLFWTHLDTHVHRLLEVAERSVLLVAPFVKEPVLRGLLEAVRPGVDVQLYTRWRVDEVAMGVSDTDVLPLLEAIGGSVRLVDELHAKLVAVDLCRALAGSANLTASGLSISTRPNLELMFEVGDPAMLAPFLAELRRRSRPATAEEAAKIEAAAAVLRSLLPESKAPDAAPVESEAPVEWWIPRFRSPDRLFRLYSDVGWFAKARSNDPALMDIAALCIPGGLDQPAFQAHVRRMLLESSAAQAVDSLLTTPQRFGAISSALQDILPHSTHPERQASTQTLIRWLLYFAGDRYGVETPNYSEILFRR